MDELERELRRVLRDDGLRVQPAPDALDRVHQGAARRRRRRRAAAGGLSGLSVVAVVVFALFTPLVSLNGSKESSSAKGSSAPEKSDAVRVKPSPLESGGRRSSARETTPAHTGGPVPARFAASSVTAMSPSAFWVLGTAPCGNPTCTSLVRTTDGGRTFRGLPAPKAALAERRETTTTVSDLRFASDTDGFAFGGALWSTHDGGGSWSRQRLPGAVVQLEADAGVAWAVVAAGDTYHLYRSPTSADGWRRVALPVPLDGTQPGLALQAGDVTLVGASGQRAVSLVSTDGGGTFGTHDRPCASEFGSQVSAFGGSIWMFCATGTSGRAYISSNAGRAWQGVDAAPPGGWPNSTVVGARGAHSAVFAAGGGLYRVSTGGNVAQTRSGSVPFRYVGFTSAKVGYAVREQPATSSLLRTVDGGRTWSVVRYS